MEDDPHTPGLYRWKRQTKPRVYSRTQKVVTTNDIQQWMQKVEEASEKATEMVLGKGAGSHHPFSREKTREIIQETTDHARIENEAYAEAEELLNQWITEKVNLQDDDTLDDSDMQKEDPWRREELGSKARREWDSLLNGNLEELGIVSTPYSKPRQSDKADPYAHIYDLDDDEAVSTVMRNMLDKELVQKTFLEDLGFDDGKKFHDPRTKMEMRHQQVKENREKRQQEIERRKKETNQKKQAQLTARQIVMKEEKDKELQMRREEQEIKKQMAKIRKEMQEVQRKEAEEKQRIQREQEEKMRLAHEELQRQLSLEEEEMHHKQQEESERRTMARAQQELEKAKQAAKNLRTLHRHFTAWYDIVLLRRLQYGKARAMADWRLTLRIWNAWRSIVRSHRITLETKRHEKNVVEENRKTLIAKKHHYLSIVRKHFYLWHDWVKQEHERQELEQAKEKTRLKMMNLLSAVADGSLWPAKENGENRGGKLQKGCDEGARQSDSETTQKKPNSVAISDRRPQSAHSAVNEIFSTPNRKMAWDENTVSSSRSESSVNSQAHQRQKILTAPWQVTRKHVNLTNDEIANLTSEGIGKQDHSDQKIRRQFGTQPWMNRHYTVNNFEHRFTAQQKLLKEQLSEIKEQKRLIQEMMFTQQQQILKQQLPGQHGSSTSPGQDQLFSDHDRNSTSKSGPEDLSPSQTGGQGTQAKFKGHGDAKKSNLLNEQTEFHGNMAGHKSSPKSPSIVIDGGDTQRSVLSTARTSHSESTVYALSTAGHNSKVNSKYLHVLKNMDERAAERARLKAERDEKRRKAEEERYEQLRAAEEEMKRRAEEEKRARVAEFKEKKRLEKQKELEKQQELERQKELNERADKHYLLSLMKFRVLVPMKKLVQMANAKKEEAVKHHNYHILRLTLEAWKNFTDEATAEKKRLADELYAYIVVRRCFHNWKNFKYRMIFLERRADRYFRDLMLPRMFEAWCQYAKEEKVADEAKLQLAKDFHPKSLLKKTFHAWRRFPQELRRDIEREKIRAEMRKKVAQLLPDFQPHVEHSTDSVP